MKYKGKKISKHRYNQLTTATENRIKESFKVGQKAIVHPDFKQFLVREGFIDDKGIVLRPIW